MTIVFSINATNSSTINVSIEILVYNIKSVYKQGQVVNHRQMEALFFRVSVTFWTIWEFTTCNGNL